MLAINAILPIFIVILSGYMLRQKFIKEDDFWHKADRLIYFIFLPLMLINVLAQAPFDPAMLQKGMVIFITIGIVGVLAFVLRPLMKAGDKEFTSIFQGIVRPNFYISLSASALLYGQEGVQFLSFLLLFIIPSATLSSVLVFQRYGAASDKSGLHAAFIRIFKNPIILSTFCGLFIAALFGGLPPLVTQTLDIFGHATLPMALLGIGATLQFSTLKLSTTPIFWACFLRLFVAPLLCLFFCFLMHFNVQETICCVLIFSVPCAASAITFSRQMGGDVTLMSSIQTIQTLCSFLSLSVMISIIHMMFGGV